MNRFRTLLLLPIILLLISFVGFASYFLNMKGKIYQQITISNINVSKLTPEEALVKLNQSFKDTSNNLSVFYDGSEFGIVEIPQVNRDYKWAVDQAYTLGRSGNLFLDIKTKLHLLISPIDLSIPVNIDGSSLEEVADTLAEKIDTDPVWPELIKVGGKYELVKGIDGLSLNKNEFIEKAKKELSNVQPGSINLSVEKVDTNVDLEKVNSAIEMLNNWGEKKILLKYKEFNKILEEKEVSRLLGLNGDYLNQIYLSALISEIVEKIETDPKDAVFEFVDGRVKEFKPEVVGVLVDKPKLASQIEMAIKENIDSIEIAVINEEPKIKAGDINNFGIKELIAVGKSSFAHSIPGRVFNVNLASSRINGVIVPPGEEFSFNKAVGEISRQTGYQTAYIISQGKTVLGDGGGVCQVSTTAFRAALDFGFPITERRAHAYRVGYYEQDSLPGIDATIFSPTTDFKFLNDTGHHILIQAKVDTKNLTMRVEIYGTHDGRKATVTKPVITSQTAAPATVYVDDPTLAKGVKKQIDWAASGAKVNFDYKVERGGETLFERKFVSNYQPWRAVYLVGTKE